jgi:gas vesicle protein
MYILELGHFVLFWDAHSKSNTEQQSNGHSQGGFVKNQCDARDATLSSSNSGSTLAFLVVGLGIGAAMSILLAPKSGADTRHWIAIKCLDGLDTANKSIRYTRRQVKDMMDQGQQKISEAVEAGREAIGRSY